MSVSQKIQPVNDYSIVGLQQSDNINLIENDISLEVQHQLHIQ